MKATGAVRRTDSAVIIWQNSTVLDKSIDRLAREDLIRSLIEKGKSWTTAEKSSVYEHIEIDVLLAAYEIIRRILCELSR